MIEMILTQVRLMIVRSFHFIPDYNYLVQCKFFKSLLIVKRQVVQMCVIYE